MKTAGNNICLLLRPHQYIKNLFIFMPLFFVGKITEPALFIHAAVAFIAFSLSASAIYILNDLKDIHDDRQHPVKKHRPLASGAISRTAAVTIMGILFISGTLIMAIISIPAFSVLITYILLNIAYIFFLKKISILDITTIAISFVLRLFIGSTVTGVTLSMWIVILTFLLALFMALAKRRDDVLIYIKTGRKMREAIIGYNLKLIDGAMITMASVVIVSYILYTTSTDVLQRMHSEYLYLTALFVIVGIMRYLQISFVEENSGSPTNIVITDRFLQMTILAWVSSFIWIIYLQ